MAKAPTGRGSAALGTAAAGIKERLKNAKIIDWQQLGTPRPDVIVATVQTPIADFRANLSAISRLQELRDLHILIRGTPRPDIAQMKFTLMG